MGRPVIKTLEVSMLGMPATNCYLVMDGGGEGFVIDPGAESRKIVDAAGEIGLRCKAVLCTHGHIDHVGAAGKVCEALGVPAMISEADAAVLQGASHGIVGRLGSVLVSKPRGRAVEYLQPGEILPFGALKMKVVPTPGHSAGSMSFVIGDSIFCGDLVFQGSVGRTDLRGGSQEMLLASVARYVWPLGDDARIYPGHGPATTVRAEKRSNPFLRGLELEA